jgi:hypothetical protein
MTDAAGKERQQLEQPIHSPLMDHWCAWLVTGSDRASDALQAWRSF